MATIIGIGGMSRAGKTFLAQKLQSFYGDTQCAMLSMDSYVYDVARLPKTQGYPNWEVPESVNYKALETAVLKCASSYKYVVVEGLLIFHNEGLNALFDERILLEVERPLFLERRVKEKRWGAESEAYLNIVWNEYQRLRNVSLNRGVRLFNGNEGVNEAFEFLTSGK